MDRPIRVIPVKYGKMVSDIVKQYALLQSSLQELRDVRSDKDGAILDYVANHYVSASRALDFLISVTSSDVKTELHLGDLEQELMSFGNIPLRL